VKLSSWDGKGESCGGKRLAAAKFGLGTPEGVRGKVRKHSHSLSLSISFGVMEAVHLGERSLANLENTNSS
jgi:hypothetical protein